MGSPCIRRFADVEPFYNGQARFERFDGAFVVMTMSGLRSRTRHQGGDLRHFPRHGRVLAYTNISAAVSLGVIEALPLSEDRSTNDAAFAKLRTSPALGVDCVGGVRKSVEN